MPPKAPPGLATPDFLNTHACATSLNNRTPAVAMPSRPKRYTRNFNKCFYLNRTLMLSGLASWPGMTHSVEPQIMPPQICSQLIYLNTNAPSHVREFVKTLAPAKNQATFKHLAIRDPRNPSAFLTQKLPEQFLLRQSCNRRVGWREVQVLWANNNGRSWSTNFEYIWHGQRPGP